MNDYYDRGNPFLNLTKAFSVFGDTLTQVFSVESDYREPIPAQDVVIEDVIEDETKEDENDGRNLCNRSLPYVR